MCCLSVREFELLSLIADEERSGREVARLYQEETGSSISYGTLYTTFRRLRVLGLVTVRDDKDQDGRFRLFKISGAGSKALKEAKRHYARMLSFGRPRPA